MRLITNLCLALGLSAVMTWSGAGCVLSSTHEKVLADLSRTQKALTDTRQSLKKCTEEGEQLATDKMSLQSELDNAHKLQHDLQTQLTKVSSDLQQLFTEKGQVEDEKERLAGRIQELSKLSKALERRAADYRTLIEKLRKMMDAGTLKVRIRNGLMVVEMSSDIVFPPGGTRIKPEARVALEELAGTLASFKGRRFQVVGHCDNKPIHTRRFPSNWELSTQRSVEVVKLLINAGVDPSMISAAGAAEFDPVADNETEEGRAQNRRVEIVFVPKIEEMPGFKEVLGKSVQDDEATPKAKPETVPGQEPDGQ
ncbi:MAG: OmpA family protein [Deltaproteobacteria bacterium]|nr:OmpA family protein [Deltaproteobacteria bacterium]